MLLNVLGWSSVKVRTGNAPMGCPGAEVQPEGVWHPRWLPIGWRRSCDDVIVVAYRSIGNPLAPLHLSEAIKAPHPGDKSVGS